MIRGVCAAAFRGRLTSGNLGLSATERMLTGQLRQQVDKLWTTFWSGGLSNPLSVIEQITYLLFMRLLDEAQTRAERLARRTGKPARVVFGPKKQHLRWSALKQLTDNRELFARVRDEVFPFLRELGGEDSAYAEHMRDATFMVPNPAVLREVVDLVDELEIADRDAKGDLYEYMLSKLQTAGQNGQFRTPRHIIRMMVELVAPGPADTICDPACGTAGFLVGAAEYVQQHHKDALLDKKTRKHFDADMFHGFDFDPTMLRIASMNMITHGIEQPQIVRSDSLSHDFAAADAYSLVLANPPFKGSLAESTVSPSLLKAVKTKKTELLFVALILRLLATGGRAAVIVPDGVLFGSSTAHVAVRKLLVDKHKLEGVISMPSGVFKPYAGVSTAVLLFTKTGAGGTDQVFFYDMQADGFSLDDKRTPTPDKDDIPDVLARWRARNPKKPGKRTDRSFFVPVKEIRDNKYDLSINRYKEAVHEAVEYDPPKVIIARLKALEAELSQDLRELEGMLG
jgi:type I restriction enzyme M protein